MFTTRARQLAESLSASAAVQISLLVSGILSARALGPSGRGDLAVILILPSVAQQLACFGLPSALTYYVARNRPAVRVIARRLVPVAAVQILVTACLLFALMEFFFREQSAAIHTAGLLTFLAVPLLVGQYYGLHILQGLGDFRWFNAFRLANPALFSVGLAIGLFFGLTVVICTVIWLAAGFAVVVGMAMTMARRMRQAEGGQAHPCTVPTRLEMIRFAAAGFLAQVSPVETFRVDTLIVAGLFPPQVVGYYAVALSISNVPRFIADAVVAVAYPQVAVQEPAHGRASTKRYMLFATLTCGGASVALALASPYVIPVVFGQLFEPAAALGVLLAITAGLTSIRRVGTDCLRALGRPTMTTAIEIATLIILAAGVVVLGEWEQGRGVAIALMASAGAGLLVTLRAVGVIGRTSSGGSGNVWPC